MEILIPANYAPYGFAVGLRDGGAWLDMLSPCCLSEFERSSVRWTPELPGNRGMAVLKCGECSTVYKGYSDTTRAASTTAAAWIETWTGLRDVTVRIEENE